MSEQAPTPSAASDAESGAMVSDRLSRRRHLLRMAAAGSPLMVSLPTRAAGPIGSAYRGAINDAIHPPLLAVSSADGWIRVAGTRFTGTYTLAADLGVPPVQYSGQLYRIEGVWYDTSGHLQVHGSGPPEPHHPAVPFATTDTRRTATTTAPSPHPRHGDTRPGQDPSSRHAAPATPLKARVGGPTCAGGLSGPRCEALRTGRTPGARSAPGKPSA